jgi:hypothetical protein
MRKVMLTCLFLVPAPWCQTALRADAYWVGPDDRGDFWKCADGRFAGWFIASKGQFYPATGDMKGCEPKGEPMNAPADPLDVVNSLRASRGLPPYRRCPLLSRAAEMCARHRARRGVHGHANDLSMNDFTFATMAGTGCTSTGAEGGWGADGSGGWRHCDGWSSCDVYEHFGEAGAAWVVAPNGQMYCSLFCR